ncbi:MAG: GAF domain-containing protein [Chloroflexi bacterium]|nr:GAF domain-containing protein [Chloroflexota bacterium]
MSKILRKFWGALVLGLVLVFLLAFAPVNQATMARESTPTPKGPDPDTDGQVGDIPRVQRYARDNDIKFERISLEQGLSDSTIFCILQDSKGFMWFGTHDGLNKYDGYDFTVYRHDLEDPNSLSNNAVRSIYEDQFGTLWVGTDGGGLDRFDRGSERFVHYQNDPADFGSLSHNSVRAIYEDQSGMLWIGTGGGGLDRFDRETERFTHYRYDLNKPNSLSHNFVTSIYQDKSGMLWIGTNGGGFDRFDPESKEFVHHQANPEDPLGLGDNYQVSTDPNSLSNNYVMTVYEDRLGNLWLGTRGGLDKFDRESGQFIHYQTDSNDPNSLSHNRVSMIYEDRLGALWVGTGGGGLDRFDRENERFVHYQTNLDDPYSLSNDRVWSVYQDRSGVLWVGTGGGGINKFDRETEKFTHYQTNLNDPDSLSHNNVTSIYKDRWGVLWVGTGGGGLNRFDQETGQFTHYQRDTSRFFSLSHNTVASIYQDRTGVIWIGTFGGLNRLNRESGRFVHYQNDPLDPYSLNGNNVRPICEDESDALWVGTSRGLGKFDRETENFTHYQNNPNDPNSLSHDNILIIYKDQSGVLWIGTLGGGLDRFDQENERFIHYQNDPSDPTSLSDNNVASVYQDQSGVLWVGTFGGGLNKFNRETETFTYYRYGENGLPGDTVYGILEDDTPPAEGGPYLWLSTNNGLSKFNPQTETFKNYDVRDGLQSNGFNAGAFYKSSDGEMFFGGDNGFNAFYADHITDNPYIPPVVLTSLTLDGESVGSSESVENITEVTLYWPNNSFEFEFAALSYVQPEKNQYAYMLEGFDQDWEYIETTRFGRYTNLPGRTYTLRVKGSNNDGIWNEDGVSVTVTVVPPFWETWWFRGLVVLVVVGGSIGGYRLQVRSVEARNRALETLVVERTHALEQRTHEIERRRQELEALYRADAELHRHLRLDQVLQALVDIAVDILRADKSSLMIWDDQRERLVVRFARGFRFETLAEMSFAPGTGTVGQVAVTGEPIIVEDTHMDPRVAQRAIAVEPEGIRSFMLVPIKVGGEVFGVFSADYVQPRAFGEDERRLFIALAQRAALAIDTAQLYEQSQKVAVLQERSRLARDLHDAVTQTLFSASLIAETLPALWESDQDEGRQLLKELRLLSRGALAEMRSLLLELRPAALAEASIEHLLHQLAEAVTGRTGIPVAVTVEGLCVLPSEVHVTLYRIAQEALNNVVKHAHANQVTVGLRCLSGTEGELAGGVELCVSDNGCGFDPSCVPSDRLGLGIIRERVQAIGATLEIESKPGQGARIVTVWQENEQSKNET